MQTLEPTYVVNQMAEGQSPVVGWTQSYAQPTMEQASAGTNPYVMNIIKPDQTARVRMEQAQAAQPQQQQSPSLLPQANPASVITATYNPTYNRCLPKILSDLDCEMKIKQVLKCIENILLEGSEIDQQSYKLPDRSSSPQLVPKKKIKVKEDEDMMVLMAQPPAGAIAANAIASAPKPGVVTKSPVRINVKVEPSETEKAQRTAVTGLYQDQGIHQVPSASPRAQPYDFSAAANIANRVQQTPQPAAKLQQTPQRAFSFEPYAFAGANALNAATTQQFLQQAFLQHPQAQPNALLLQQQQQHLQAVQQHLQAQQQLLNAVNSGNMQLHPLLQHANLQYSLPQAMAAHLQHTGVAAHGSPAHTEGQQPATQPQQTQEGAPFAPVQMDEFPFPVFSSTILEEVNHLKPASREEGKKEGEDPVYFFGGPTGTNPLLFPTQVQTEASQQLSQPSAEGAHPEHRPSGLGSSALLLQHGHNLPLLFQMPQLTGLEEDDKWILSLLNIDGISHENMQIPPPAGF